MVNRREVMISAAACAAASIGGAALAKVTEAPSKIYDILLYGARHRKGEFDLMAVLVPELEIIPCTEPRLAVGWPPVNDPYILSRDFVRDSLHGLAKCEADGIEPLGFVLSNRAYCALWLNFEFGGWPDARFFLGLPVVLLNDGEREGAA